MLIEQLIGNKAKISVPTTKKKNTTGSTVWPKKIKIKNIGNLAGLLQQKFLCPHVKIYDTRFNPFGVITIQWNLTQLTLKMKVKKIILLKFKGPIFLVDLQNHAKNYASMQSR